MKILPLTIAALLLCSCVSQPSRNEAEAVAPHVLINFSGAKDSRFPELNLRSQVITKKPAKNGDIEIISFPLSYAIACNPEKTSCKHAVVKTELKIATRVVGENAIQVSGVLLSEIGRSLAWSSPVSSQRTTMTVPGEVGVIAELKNEQPFERVIRFGERIELKGLGGVEVILETN